MAALSRVQEKGQVTIPAKIRQRLGLEKGSLVAFVETKQGVLITPQEVVATELLDQLGQALKQESVDLDELIAAGRQIRGELTEQEYQLADEEE